VEISDKAVAELQSIISEMRCCDDDDEVAGAQVNTWADRITLALLEK
jgi:hypothetical protein